MSEVRLVVREAGCDWSGTIHGSMADQAIAALSADPVTRDELEAAMARFNRPPESGRMLGWFRPHLDDEPYDAGLVVIDLVARMVTIDSTYSYAGHKGYVDYHNGQHGTDISLRYHLADDWQIDDDGNQWRHRAEARRRERAARPAIDARAVFYGRPLLEFVARECLAAFGRRAELAANMRAKWVEEARARLAKRANVAPDQIDDSLLTEAETMPYSYQGDDPEAGLYYDALKDIHAAWLLTPREDLGGACPREVALERREHISWDLQDRRDQWSAMDRCPPGLAETSHAFLHGGFGSHELLKYYDLVRELLYSCWEQLTELAMSPNPAQRPETLTAGDFLTTEVPRLEAVREAWLDAPDEDCHRRTPRSIINRERSRIPEAASGREAMVDPDCPCCQMMADMPGPMFWHLDGCNNDDEFAFDIYYRTREDWDEEQRRQEEFDRRFDAKCAERERLGVTSADAQNAEGVWNRSYSVGDANVPLGVRVFGIGCHLAELIVGLRGDHPREDTPVEAQRHIDQLNRSFGNLREVLQGTELSLSASLLEPVLQRFMDDLSVVATDRPELSEPCEMLTDELRQLLNPPAEMEPDLGDDVPF